MTNLSDQLRKSLLEQNVENQLDAQLLNAAISLVFVQGVETRNETKQGKWSNMQLLFMQRAEHPKDPWSGHIAFPGGGVESFDGNTLSAAIRETHEEMGFVLSQESWVGGMKPIYGPVLGNQKEVCVYPHVFLLDKMPVLELNEEAQSAFWVPIDRLMVEKFVFDFEHPFKPDQKMYGIDLGLNLDAPLWGLSLSVLYNFFQVAGWPVEQEMITFYS